MRKPKCHEHITQMVSNAASDRGFLKWNATCQSATVLKKFIGKTHFDLGAALAGPYFKNI